MIISLTLSLIVHLIVDPAESWSAYFHRSSNAVSLCSLSSISVPQTRGLSNLGNTCFFNSVMQNLVNTDVLVETLCCCARSSRRGDEGPLTKALAVVLCEMRTGGVRGIVPGSMSGKHAPYAPRELIGEVVRKAPQFKGHRQQVCWRWGNGGRGRLMTAVSVEVTC